MGEGGTGVSMGEEEGNGCEHGGGGNGCEHGGGRAWGRGGTGVSMGEEEGNGCEHGGGRAWGRGERV